MQKLAKLITNKPFVYSLWFGLSLFLVIKGVLAHQGFNNYTIFKYNFLNTIHQHNLYAYQPEHYYDLNHYGPIFSIIMAPFAILPDSIGVILWVLFNAFILFKAIQLLPLKNDQYVIVLLLCAHELMTASANVQSNPMIAALIILSFNFIKREKDFWAALMIALGAFIKLYGIVGLAFFFFSANKPKFMLSFIFWSAVLFVLPMSISSPSFIIQTYHDWYADLVVKNSDNQQSYMQEICVTGFIRRVFHYDNLKNMYVIGPALVLFALSYLRIGAYKVLEYQRLILSSVLIFAVIFSSSAESSTYIIAFVGVAVWFMNLNRPVTGFEIFLLVLALLITSLSPSDLFPSFIRTQYIVPYKLKSIPCFLIWLKIIYETLTRDFVKEKESVLSPATV
ncbi:glycosyltransferase family 87 protein [Mucilaginibacter sp. cycad4]|uniref:glycosyltransferase family 87 protein n=1 Tax=Mucilaginibacter sp. cycad4 TaxID=3342096 RepID=UPI002AAC440B|nr:glycosyltransferase family 87 protein [Mucilaginibacter gossypii]WPV00572.1 glycosyltransferase family 87 protein [Mucilaginibacter gossypii]